MIDVENELRQGTVYTPDVFLVKPSDDFDQIALVALGHTSGLRVKAKAHADALNASSILPEEVRDNAYSEEFERRLIYWSVVYGLSVNDKPAYQYYDPATNVKLDLDHVINYVENRLGLHHQAFKEIGWEVLEKSGLLYLLEQEEEKDDPITQS